MVQNVYSWDIIHRYFPPEQIEKYRQQIINDWKSGLFKNEEIWEKYGMSENTFYDLLKRYSKENEAVSYTHLRAHETRHDLVCRLLLEKKKKKKKTTNK